MDPHGGDPAHPFAVEGEVVEIFEEAGERRAKVVLRPDSVVDVVASENPEVHLGDHVVVAGTITIDTIRVKAGGATRPLR